MDTEIPTGIYPGYCPKEEKLIYSMIASRTLAAFAPDCQTEALRVEAAALADHREQGFLNEYLDTGLYPNMIQHGILILPNVIRQIVNDKGGGRKSPFSLGKDTAMPHPACQGRAAVRFCPYIPAGNPPLHFPPDGRAGIHRHDPLLIYHAFKLYLTICPAVIYRLLMGNGVFDPMRIGHKEFYKASFSFQKLTMVMFMTRYAILSVYIATGFTLSLFDTFLF
jgi:hypothetical protein